MEFNMFDGFVIIVTLILAIKGFVRGIIKEIAGLVGIIGGMFLASRYYVEAGNYVNDNLFTIQNHSAVNLVGFIAVFISIWLIVWVIGEIVSKIFAVAQLGFLDKLGGAIFSGGKFFLLVSIFISLFTQIDYLKEKLNEYQKDSVTYPIMLKLGNSIIKLKPEDIQKQIDDVKQKIDDNVGESVKKNIEEVKKQIVDKVSKEVADKVNSEINKSMDK